MASAVVIYPAASRHHPCKSSIIRGIFRVNPRSSVFWVSSNTLKTLRVDRDYVTASNALKYYTLIPSVTHLVLCGMPTQNYPYDDAYLYVDPVNSITTLTGFRHQYSPDSAPTLLFPSLEIFEAYDIVGVTDIMLLEFIKARIDATKSNAGVSRLKKVLVEFSRTRETDIVPEALAHAQAAGIKLELYLKYSTTRKELVSTRTPPPSLEVSGAPDDSDVSWAYPLYDY
jgi:hypothetical protein